MGRILMTIVLAAQVLLAFLLDWSGNHLLNPVWHGHARFHGALLLFYLAGNSATAIWLLWRPTLEPETAMTTAALVSAWFWMPFFYITWLLPGSTWWAGDPQSIPHLAGHVFYPNVATAVVFLVLTGAAWRAGLTWSRNGRSPSSARSASPSPAPARN